jgi:hypothetical protein
MWWKVLSVSVLLLLAAVGLTVAIGIGQGLPHQEDVVWIPPQAQEQAAGLRVYEGWIKDVRPAWDLLVLTVGKGKKARDLRFDMGEARIVGPDGSEWKGQDLRIGDRVRVELTADGTLVQQISVLPDSISALGS